MTAVIADGNSSLWLTDSKGMLTHLNTETGDKESFNLNVPNSENNSIVVKGDSLLIGTYSGLVVFDKTKREIIDRYEIGNKFINPVKIDEKGNLYVGTFGDGLYIFDCNMNTLCHLNVNSGFPSNTINDIHIYGNSIWVATSEGLVKIDSSDYTKYEIAASPLRLIYSIISDNQGNIWYSTGAGIGVVKTDGSHKFYDREIPISGFNVASVAKHPSGRLYFGTNRGVLTFSPEYVISNKWQPRPVISDVIINTSNKDFDFTPTTRSGETIELSYDQNNFTLVINTLNFFFQNGTFEYRLKGLDDAWYEMKGGNEITYRDLPYGDYEFQIKNPSGEYEIVSLRIQIHPPFWMTWWAKTIYLLLALGVIYYIVKEYKSRLRKKSDTELEENKQAHIQELNDERLKFFTNITHELRTPLTLIMGPLDDINQNSSLDEKDKWKIQVIHKNARHLLNLVNQILDFRKTETQNKRLCVAKGDIVKAVKEVSMKYVELNRNPNINFSVTSSVEEIITNFDQEVITMIMDNLISNALKYTEVGLVSVSVVAEQIEDKRVVRLSVKDTGYGISQDALPHIFDRYYQEKSNHQAYGTGIGLALVRALVELHQGKITVESAKDVGTCFSITLDRDNEYPDALHSENLIDGEKNNEQAIETEGNKNETNDRIEDESDNIVVLIVEDNPDILEYVEQSFSGIFDVKTASNGRDGLEIAKSIVPDIIVTDIMMPIMDGLEMSRLLKNDMVTSHIPIIMLTAKDTIADKEAGYKIGVDSYLTKPFNSSLLLTRINNIIAQRRLISEYFRTKAREIVISNASSEMSKEEGMPIEASLSKVDKEFIEKLDKAIIDNLSSEKVNIDYLTDTMCMSRASLYRKIKALTGMSSNEYIRAIRMRIARELLLEGSLSITEISERVGSSSPTYFRESFKAFYGVSPSQYVKNNK